MIDTTGETSSPDDADLLPAGEAKERLLAEGFHVQSCAHGVTTLMREGATFHDTVVYQRELAMAMRTTRSDDADRIDPESGTPVPTVSLKSQDTMRRVFNEVLTWPRD